METPDTPTTKPKPATMAPLVKRVLWPTIGLGPHLAATALLGALVLFAFVNSLHNTGFALDNKFIILEDPRLREAKGENVRLIFTQDYWWPKAVSGLYRPLTTLSYLVNYSVLGNADRATGYHWVNFLLHWGNAVLVYFLVLVLIEKLWPALLTAALFAVHPIVTESVTNIVGRADLLALTSVLGGFLCYVKSTITVGWKRYWWLSLLMVVTALGVFCKESAVVVAGVLFLYDITYRWQRRHPNWLASAGRNLWEFFIRGYVFLLPPLLTLWWVRRSVFANLRPAEFPFVDNPLVETAFWPGRLTAIKVIGRYFMLLVWPKTLSCDYSFNQIPVVNLMFRTWEDWQAIVALAVIVALVIIAIRQYTRHKAVFFFILFFFGTLFPTSNLLPPSIQKVGSIMAERFLYMPSLGFAGCVVILVYSLCRLLVWRLDVSGWAQRLWLQMMARSLLGIIIILFGVRTFLRNYDWEDDERLWTQAVQACPNSFKTHKSLAFALYEKDPEGKNIDRIIDEGEKSAAITDRAQIVFLHLGAYYRIKGDLLAQRAPDGTLIPSPESRKWYQKSADALRRAVPLDRAFNDENRQQELRRGRKPDQIPDIGNHEIYWNLGLSYMRLSQHTEAFDAYIYMRHLAPSNPDAYLSLASVYIATGKLEEAAVALLQALLLDNNRQEALRLLTNIYRQIDREGCAIITSPPVGGLTQSQPRLNADCPLVRRHICSAYYTLVQVFLEAKQLPLAHQTKQSALTAYGCPPELFNQLLPDTPAPAAVKK